ncbi:MAG: hypothetical protein IGBAC_1259 [Ignavibacteriae bacterium]|nr:MAG: hypothetical protein IGBAC_1259 [Ignavibacteriota bacterium]
MKKYLLFFMIAFPILYFVSCSRVSEEELWKQSQTLIEEGKHKEAIEKLKQFVKEFPKSEKAPDAQFYIASIYNNDLHEFENAIEEYRNFVEMFPEHSNAPKALFLIGFIYNNQLHQLDKAKSAYEEFLNKYPDHELTQSAQIEIQTLGKNPEELIPPEIVSKEKK